MKRVSLLVNNVLFVGEGGWSQVEMFFHSKVMIKLSIAIFQGSFVVSYVDLHSWN